MKRVDTSPHVGDSILLNLYEMMMRIRLFELEVQKRYRQQEIPGFVHLSLGQEACAAGAVGTLRSDDYVSTTHRGHGHALAKGIDMKGMAAELYGRSEGILRGRGGSMHLADPDRGLLGANAIVGANLPIAVGAAWSSKQLGFGRISLVFFGEGATHGGLIHESMNMAAIWALPVLFFCENNGYAEFSAHKDRSAIKSVVELASVFGIDSVHVDGNDVEAVFKACSDAVGVCRDGPRPFLIEAHTQRWGGHYEGDPEHYRDSEAGAVRANDPVKRAHRSLIERGVSEASLVDLESQVQDEVTAAFERAFHLAEPNPAGPADV